MSNIILRGGFLNGLSHINKLKPVNIILSKSPEWIDGILHVNSIHVDNKPYYRLLSSNTNLIEIVKKNNMNMLMVNNSIIYDSENLFSYHINVKLNESLKYEKYKCEHSHSFFTFF